jgi:hypothetical protein
MANNIKFNIKTLKIDYVSASACLWDGSTDTAWNTADNRVNCGGGAPTSADDVGGKQFALRPKAGNTG